MSILTKRAILAAMAVIGASLAAPQLATAQTPCAKWDVSQPWIAVQGRYKVVFKLMQRETTVRGTGVYHTPGSGALIMPAFGTISEPLAVVGTVKGSSIELETAWGGVYVGRINATGRIDGYTYDKRNSNSSATWYSDRRMNCLARVGAPVSPTAKQPIPSTPHSPALPIAVPNGTPNVFIPSRGSASSSVFRPAPAQAPAPVPVSTPAPPRPPSVYCKSGFVWRVARPTDLVCVTPESRARVAKENRTAAKRVQPGGGAYGPNTCRNGYVWREAFVGDGVCVKPQIRALVLQENQIATTRVQ